MILLLAVVAAVFIALLRGGRFEHLLRVPLRRGWLALVAFALQIVEIYFPLPQSQGFVSWRTFLLLFSYLLLILVVAVNRRLPGLLWIGLGLSLNLAVMLVNGGYMPITPEAVARAGLGHLTLGENPGARLLATKDILLPREATRLWFLSDILVLAPPSPLRTVFSVGDVCLALGAFIFFQRTMRPPVPRGAAAGEPAS